MPQHLRLQKFGTMSDSKCSHGCPSIRNSALRSTRIMMVMVLVQLMMILLFSPCVVTAKCATATTTRTRTSLFPLQVLPIPTFAHPESNLTVLVQPPTKRGRPLPPRAAYLLTTTESFTVVVPEYDNGSSSSNSSSSNSSNNSNSKLERTSVQAGNRHCTYASNGGPFSRDGSCVGAVVANGRTVVGEFGAGAVGFGVAYYSVSPRRRRRRPSSLRRQQEEEEDGNDDDGDDRELVWVVGAIESAAQAAGLGLRHFVTGFDWLVYDGKAVASAFNNTTGAEEAPRTAVGVNQQGKLMLLVADGCELWYVCHTLEATRRTNVSEIPAFSSIIDCSYTKP